MKSTRFIEILDEELVEVNKSVPKTIQCLQEQEGLCRSASPDNSRMFFECSDKGELSVAIENDGTARSRIHTRGMFQFYYVYGKVISQDNKTYVKITSLYKKLDILKCCFLLAFIILLLPLLILYVLLNIGFNILALAAVIMVYMISIICLINSFSKRKNNGPKMIEIMKNEMKRRVQNIARWDD